MILAASSVVGGERGDRDLLDSILTMWRKTRSLAWRHWEQAESTMQLMAAEKVIKKAGLSKDNWIFFLPEICWGS